jgi:NADH-quinone oxidoreductase subunit L
VLLLTDWFLLPNPANGWAAIKAFTVTRVGDVFLLIALFLLYQQFGTLYISTSLKMQHC